MENIEINSAASCIMSSRLLELPAELRVRIYEYTFGDNCSNEIELFKAIESHPETALLRTCRQIHNEAQPTHAAASKRYRDSKTFTVMLDRKADSTADVVELIERLDRLKFPLLVKDLRFSWLGSTAALHIKIDQNEDVQYLTHEGECPGTLKQCVRDQHIRSKIIDHLNSMHYVLQRDNEGKALGVVQFLILVFVLSTGTRDDARKEAFINAMKGSRICAISCKMFAQHEPKNSDTEISDSDRATEEDDEHDAAVTTETSEHDDRQ